MGIMEAQEALIKMQQNNDVVHHLQSLVESVYHYDEIATLNPDFDDTAFEQLLIYISILVQNLITKSNLNPNCIVKLYITIIHLVFKYSRLIKTKKHVMACLARMNTLIQAQPQDGKQCIIIYVSANQSLRCSDRVHVVAGSIILEFGVDHNDLGEFGTLRVRDHLIA